MRNPAPTKLEKARIRIVLDHGWIAPTLARYPIKFRDDIPLAGIDRKGQIFVNPVEVEKLTIPQIVHLLAHEVMHRWGLDCLRVGNREPKRWNIACDAYINDTLVEANIGEPIPGGVYMPGSRTQTKEDIYDKLPEDGSSGGEGSGSPGEGEPSEQSSGKFDDLLDEGDDLTEQQARDLEETILNDARVAEQLAKSQGKATGALGEFFADLLESKVPWHEALLPYMTSFKNQDSTWTRPNRRFLSQGIVLPSTDRVPSMGGIALQIDVSGSISKPELDHYNAHMQAIIEQCNPAWVDVYYVDTRVVHEDHFDDDLSEVKLTHYSGGGTNMPEGLDYIEKSDRVPEVVVVLTDGYTNWPTHAYPWPVVWVISTDIVAPAEHGLTIPFEVTD